MERKGKVNQETFTLSFSRFVSLLFLHFLHDRERKEEVATGEEKEKNVYIYYISLDVQWAWEQLVRWLFQIHWNVKNRIRGWRDTTSPATITASRIHLNWRTESRRERESEKKRRVSETTQTVGLSSLFCRRENKTKEEERKKKLPNVSAVKLFTIFDLYSWASTRNKYTCEVEQFALVPLFFSPWGMHRETRRVRKWTRNASADSAPHALHFNTMNCER